jgi:hypothetical protein
VARIIPDGWKELTADDVLPNEAETLYALERALPDDYTVYHGVCWTKIHDRGYAVFGEIDFIVLEPSGSMLLVEQKDGSLLEEPDGLTKEYIGTRKNVPSQMARNVKSLLTKLRKAVPNKDVHLDSLLYCPGHVVRKKETAGVPIDRIVDGLAKANLAKRIQELRPCGPARPDVTKAIHAFLADVMDFVPNAQLALDKIGVIQTRLSGGLSNWARKLDFAPFRLQVVGTAGSGKTQLAMGVITDAAYAGRSVLYVCFNRPLADHVRELADGNARAVGYHQLCDQTFRAAGGIPDFSTTAVFGQLEAFMDSYQPTDDELVDELVVDEGQDFREGWRTNLLRFLRPDGRVWWLEDPLQNLYDRPALNFDGWVTLRSDANYRSPRELLDLIDWMLPAEFGAQAGSPLRTAGVQFLNYPAQGSLLKCTSDAVKACIDAGFSVNQIAIITFRGWGKSEFKARADVAGYALVKPTGTYDAEGNPIYTEGQLRIDTVYRLKGHSAPCVVLTEVDFETMSSVDMRKLFVGITRATAKFVMVCSDCVMQRMYAPEEAL